VAKIEDLETGQQDLSAASDQELQKLREDLSQQREAAVALTLENDRLGLALDRVEGELEYLEEHQGDDVRQLEVQVGEGAAAVEAAAAQRAILQKELNNATYKLARASRMKDRLAALPDRVKEELVRLMVKNQVSLDDFNSECLKLLKFVPPETALELLQAFFLGRDFGSRATSENLVCVVLFEAKVITKLLCMLI
jgi:chromosome segregation ATPase